MQEIQRIDQASKTSANSIGKVLSFEISGEVYLLGCPTFEIQLFENSGDCDEFFNSCEEMCEELGAAADQVKQAYSLILEGTPRLHDIADEDTLSDGDIVVEPSPAIVVAGQGGIEGALMVFIKCNGTKVKEFRDAGVPYLKQPFMEDLADIRQKIVESSERSKDQYINPRLKKIESWRFVDGGSSIQ